MHQLYESLKQNVLSKSMWLDLLYPFGVCQHGKIS